MFIYSLNSQPSGTLRVKTTELYNSIQHDMYSFTYILTVHHMTKQHVLHIAYSFYL